MDIGEKIRILLSNRDWTHKELAKNMYVTESAVQKWCKGKNRPTMEKIEMLSNVFDIPILNLVDDSIEIPEYYVVDQYLPYWIGGLPEDKQDSEHVIIEAYLEDNALLHRFNNCAGEPCSAIYQRKEEVWWYYRENEARMIHTWNEVHKA